MEAYFGEDSTLDDLKSAIFLQELKEPSDETKMNKALPVFYEELVQFYANKFIRGEEAVQK